MRGTHHGRMRQRNRSAVLDVLRQQGPLSRADIARATDLTKPTVSSIIGELLEAGLARETGVGASRVVGGRPPVLVEFDVSSRCLVGIHVGVRRISVVAADARGQVLGDLVDAPTPLGRPEEALSAAAGLARRALAEAGIAAERLSGVGVCVPGLVDAHTGTVAFSPNLGWRDQEVGSWLGKDLGVPVFVHNLAEACAAAELVEGAARLVSDSAFLYVASSIEVGVITGGALYRGAAGFAGQIGHCQSRTSTELCTCGNVGCLETAAALPALVRSARQQLSAGRPSALTAVAERGQLTARSIADAADEGDELAREVIGKAGQELGEATAWLINLFNPELVVVGGDLTVVRDLMVVPLRQAALRHVLPQGAARVTITTSALHLDSEVRGSVLVAMQALEARERALFAG